MQAAPEAWHPASVLVDSAISRASRRFLCWFFFFLCIPYDAYSDPGGGGGGLRSVRTVPHGKDAIVRPTGWQRSLSRDGGSRRSRSWCNNIRQ